MSSPYFQGEAVEAIKRQQKQDPDGRVDMLFLDGTPKEYMDYLTAAEPMLAPGALIVADNAGVFKDGGLKPYLEYVRTSGKYESSSIPTTLEWRDDVEDALEVSVWQG